MTREEAIQELQNCKGLIQQDGQDYLDERDIPLLDMAIEALSADAVSLTGTMKYLTKPHNYCEVVRCKDCKWQEECSQLITLHKFHGVYQEISFCSYGERREPLPQYAEWKDAFEKMTESAKVGDHDD